MPRALVLTAACAALALCACQKKDANAPASAASGTAAPAAAPTPVAAGDMPHARPGLWKMAETMDGGRHVDVQMCIDEKSAADMAALAGNAAKDNKCHHAVSRGADGSINISGACDMGQYGKSTTNGVMRGDFNSHYTVHMDNTMSGSQIPAMNRAHTVDIDAQWTGPCAPGQKGGDMAVNGMHINAAGGHP
jgi:hypothetical protein